MAGAPSPAALVEELKSLVAANVAGSVELVARLSTVIREAAGSPPPAPPDGTELLARLIEVGLASYAELNNHTLALLGSLVGVAERALSPAASSSGASGGRGPGPGRVDVSVEGRVGERISCPFLVENHYEQAVDVSFRAEPLTSAGRPDLPPSLVTFEPPRLGVLPRGSAVATAVVEVTPDFAVGATYLCTIRLVGFEGREIGLALTVAPREARPRKAGPARVAAKEVSRTRPPRVRGADGAVR